MTAYQINNLIMDKFHTKISPSVIYAKLAVMESLYLIEWQPHNGKTYDLTEKGKELLGGKSWIIKEIHRSTITLLES